MKKLLTLLLTSIAIMFSGASQAHPSSFSNTTELANYWAGWYASTSGFTVIYADGSQIYNSQGGFGPAEMHHYATCADTTLMLACGFNGPWGSDQEARDYWYDFGTSYTAATHIYIDNVLEVDLEGFGPAIIKYLVTCSNYTVRTSC